MPTPRLVHAVALAAVLAACGDRAPTTPAPTPAAGPAAKPPEVAPPAPGSAPATAPPAAGKTSDPAPSAATAGGPAGAAPGAPQAVGAPAVAQDAPATPGAVAAGGTAPPGAAAAPGPFPVSTVLKAAVALEPGGASLPLARDAETVVDPGARFEVVLSVTSPDARLVLLDSKDAAVAAEEAHEVGQSTRLTLAPSAPLTPGRRYTLRIDGASTRELHDTAGKPFVPSTLAILVAGTPPAEPKEQPSRRKRRR